MQSCMSQQARPPIMTWPLHAQPAPANNPRNLPSRSTPTRTRPLPQHTPPMPSTCQKCCGRGCCARRLSWWCWCAAAAWSRCRQRPPCPGSATLREVRARMDAAGRQGEGAGAPQTSNMHPTLVNMHELAHPNACKPNVCVSLHTLPRVPSAAHARCRCTQQHRVHGPSWHDMETRTTLAGWRSAAQQAARHMAHSGPNKGRGRGRPLPPRAAHLHRLGMSCSPMTGPWCARATPPLPPPPPPPLLPLLPLSLLGMGLGPSLCPRCHCRRRPSARTQQGDSLARLLPLALAEAHQRQQERPRPLRQLTCLMHAPSPLGPALLQWSRAPPQQCPTRLCPLPLHPPPEACQGVQLPQVRARRRRGARQLPAAPALLLMGLRSARAGPRPLQAACRRCAAGRLGRRRGHQLQQALAALGAGCWVWGRASQAAVWCRCWRLWARPRAAGAWRQRGWAGLTCKGCCMRHALLRQGMQGWASTRQPVLLRAEGQATAGRGREAWGAQDDAGGLRVGMGLLVWRWSWGLLWAGFGQEEGSVRRAGVCGRDAAGAAAVAASCSGCSPSFHPGPGCRTARERVGARTAEPLAA